MGADTNCAGAGVSSGTRTICKRLPEADANSTQDEVNRRCEDLLNDEGNVVSLGTYGGYITMKFDHPIVNKHGSDFLILGNGMYATDDPKYGNETIGGSIEPGIVYVGVGDNLETAKWYELAGSEYYTNEIHDFEITYFKPTTETCEHQLFGSVCDNYIKWDCTWTDAKGERRDSTGYHMKNQYHIQTYWPQWEGKDQLTFKGGCLPNNAVMYSPQYWVQYRYAKTPMAMPMPVLPKTCSTPRSILTGLSTRKAIPWPSTISTTYG